LAPKPETQYGRTAFDLAAELLKHRTVVAALVFLVVALVSGIGYGLKEGYLEVHQRPSKPDEIKQVVQPDGTQGSPYVFWHQLQTSLDLEKCKSIVAQTYTLAGATMIETPDSDKTFWAQVSVSGSVTAVVMCSFFPKGANLQVFASGPDSSESKIRAGKLFQVASGLLAQQSIVKK